jgi:hypothetical protein
MVMADDDPSKGIEKAVTHREKDAGDLVFLRQWFAERNVSRRGAEGAENIITQLSSWFFSALSAPLREKIFTGMHDFDVLHALSLLLKI